MPAKVVYDGGIKAVIWAIAKELNPEIAGHAIEICRKNCPKGKTKRLVRSLKIEKVYPEIVITANTPYAATVEFGRRPLLITPKVKQVLKFTKEGKTIYAKYARQPARVGQFFMAKSGMEVKEKFPMLVGRVITRGVRV